MQTQESIRQNQEEMKRFALLQSKDMLTIDEVALFMNTSKRHVYRLTSENKLPHYKPNGKLMYFDKKEINDWLKRNRVATEEEAEQKAIAYSLRKKGV